MSKRFIHSINYMRGLCMLGVIAIHVGSVAIVNPSPNLALVAVLEILSRFSVPAFFFLSAFGMFYSQGLHEPFDYKDYLQRRLRTVFVPYLAWSFFYMAYVSVLSHNLKLFHPYAIFRTLWYGLAMYHIYFLVILLWFYLLMPLWRPLLRLMDRKPILSFTALFIV
ncbi:MAG: acyltransferase, partial [Megasphaera sp.]|nr:acyltransferase [Megasphaera sp.]